MNNLLLTLQSPPETIDRQMSVEELQQAMGGQGLTAVFPDEGVAISFWGLFLGLMLMMLAISFVISIAVAWFIYKPYSKLPTDYQTLAPGWIWGMLVPLANLVIILLIALQVPEAFKRYFSHVGDASVGDCGKTVAQIWAIATLCCFVPIVNYIAGVVALVCLIMFTMKLWELAAKIERTTPNMAEKTTLPEMAR